MRGGGSGRRGARRVARRTPLFVRISASDWAEGGWDIEQSVTLAKVLKRTRWI